jgi:hypothetical protein
MAEHDLLSVPEGKCADRALHVGGDGLIFSHVIPSLSVGTHNDSKRRKRLRMKPW